MIEINDQWRIEVFCQSSYLGTSWAWKIMNEHNEEIEIRNGFKDRSDALVDITHWKLILIDKITNIKVIA